MSTQNSFRALSAFSFQQHTKEDQAISARPAYVDGSKERILLDEARCGDIQAFESLIHLHRQFMYRSALRVTEHHEDAEEALQEAMLSAYRNLKQFQGDAQFRTWLTRIAINHALMIRRKRKSGRVVPLSFETDDGELIFDPADIGPNPEQSCYRREMSRRLQMAIERLSPTLRSAFVLRHVDELTPAQAAKALGVSIPAFKSRLMRARQTLRRRLTYAVEPAAGRCRDS